MNNILLAVGKLTKNPELKYTQNNKAVCEVNLAIGSGDDTTFLPITMFGKMAETTKEYCHKGDLLGINGTIKNNNWKDKEGKTHYNYVFMANKVSFLSSKGNYTSKEESGLKKPKNELKENVKEWDLGW